MQFTVEDLDRWRNAYGMAYSHRRVQALAGMKIVAQGPALQALALDFRTDGRTAISGPRPLPPEVLAEHHQRLRRDQVRHTRPSGGELHLPDRVQHAAFLSALVAAARLAT